MAEHKSLVAATVIVCLTAGYPHWKAEIITEFDPMETNLDRFVTMDKSDFIGKSALARRLTAQSRKSLVTLVLDSRLAAAHGGASVMSGDKVVGTVTSGAWGYRTEQNIAMAFVDKQVAVGDAALEVDLLGTMVSTRIIPPSPYDPKQTRFRASQRQRN